MYRNGLMISLVALAASLALGGCATGVEDEIPSTVQAQGITGIKDGIGIHEHQAEAQGNNDLNPALAPRVVLPQVADKDMKLKSKKTVVPHPEYEEFDSPFAPKADLDNAITQVAPQFVPQPEIHEDPAGQQ